MGCRLSLKLFKQSRRATRVLVLTALLTTEVNPVYAASSRMAGWRTPIEVLCVGDSITAGVGAVESYPFQLGNMLGSRFVVLNEGVPRATMLKRGDLPYWYQPDFVFASWKPNIVVLMLGTNDSKPQNWQSKSQFVTDYEQMVRHFENLPTHPIVFLNTPPTVYHDGLAGINDNTIRRQIVPLVKQIAHRMHLPMADVYSATHAMPQNFPDNVHPNDAGAHAIAASVYQAIQLWDRGK